jgi:hypothetical protein
LLTNIFYDMILTKISAFLELKCSLLSKNYLLLSLCHCQQRLESLKTQQCLKPFQNKRARSQTLVAHACNPSYLRGREQEDWDLKPTGANSSRHPILKIPNTKKKAGRVIQLVKHLPSKLGL